MSLFLISCPISRALLLSSIPRYNQGCTNAGMMQGSQGQPLGQVAVVEEELTWLGVQPHSKMADTWVHIVGDKLAHMTFGGQAEARVREY